MSTLEVGKELRVCDRSGEEVGAFVVRGLRAQGGQGFVYTLRGPGGRPAVLKVPSPKGLVCAEIEQRILLNLPVHKNLITLIGLATVQGVECSVFGWAFQNPYLRLNAPSLRNVTRRFRGAAPKTALPATTSIEMIQEVLASLEHIHRYGFVHGDIKPGNVLIEIGSPRTRLPNEDYFGAIQQRAYRTIVADFGSARSVQFLKDQGAKGGRLAPSEYTPLYAPPEVFKKEPEHSLTAVDVYQVGLMLYQVVSGHLPYDHLLPQASRGGLSRELVQLKREEADGRLRAFDPALLRGARQQDVVFAEAFASQKVRDRFYDDVERIVDLATTAAPGKRPTITQLRGEVFRLFELEPPGRPAPKGRPQVSVWNPRWHLTRDNRLADAARVPDAVRPGGAEPAGGPPTERGRRPPPPPAAGAPRATDVRRPPPPPAGRPAGGRPPAPATPPPRAASDRRRPPPAATPARAGSDRHAQPEQWPGRTASGRGPAVRPEPPPSEYTGEDLSDALSAWPGAGPDGVEPGGEGEVAYPAEPENPLEGRKVALVDDDRVALAVLGRALRKRGCLVRTFQDPESALESISRDQPHAAIVDMQMPGMSGIELVKRLTRRLSGQPFPLLMLSSVEEEEVLKEAYRHGVRDYLVKPVTEAELAVKLEKALRDFGEESPQGVPRELAGFELLEELRRGDVAIVFRAADVWDRYPDVVKAVKVVRPDVASEAEPLLKLRREIDLLASCEHPGLARMSEAGLVGRLLFYVADEIPARSLAKEVRESGPLPPDEVLHALRDVADTLAYLHGLGILVADLTPESLGRRDDGRIVITELGSARWLGPALRLDEPAPVRTRFAAPELFEDPPRYELGADLYSLGVTVLEAFAGKPAVRNRATGAIDVGPLTQGLPPELAAVLARLVAPLPEERFSGARALLAELDRIAR